jgi:hypothetical protein
MDEEKLASALSAQIDAVLAGQRLAVEDEPEEVRQLLALVEPLVAVDVQPRPAFGHQLKRSLLDRGRGGGGASGLGGPPSWLMLALVAVVSLVGLGVLGVILTATVVLPQHNLSWTPTSPAPSPIITPTPTSTPVQSTLTPTAKATATQVDTIRPTPASARDKLAPKATPTSTPPLERGDQPADGNTGRDSHGDSKQTDDHGCNGCDNNQR